MTLPPRLRIPGALPSVVLAALLAALFTAPAPAANRALLIGVAQDAGGLSRPLPGIDLDLDMMRGLAAWLGFAPAEIQVMQDREATAEAVQRALGGWLREGVGPEDRVLLYFSGHGSQVPDLNGDETADAADEVLVLSDLAPALTPDGRASLTGVLLDDDLERALAAIASRRVLVVLDACHSGTATRSYALAPSQSGARSAVVKSYTYPGMPTGNPESAFRTLSRRPAHVSLAAAADDERSLSTERGSYFTLGLAEAVGSAAAVGRNLSAREALDAAAAFVAASLGPAGQALLFHPQIEGDPRLTEAPLGLIPAAAGAGPHWQRLRALAASRRVLEVRANRTRFALGETLELTLEVPFDGWLNLIAVDARDSSTVLFPNRRDRAHRVTAGPLRLPGTRPFSLPAVPPAGPVLLVAVLTAEPLDLYETGDGRRDAAGTLLDDYPRLSAVGTRAFAVAARAGGAVAAGLVETEVCPAAGCAAPADPLVTSQR